MLSDHSRPPDRRKKRFRCFVDSFQKREERISRCLSTAIIIIINTPKPQPHLHSTRHHIKYHAVALISSCCLSCDSCPGNNFVATKAARGRRIAPLLNSEDSAVGSAGKQSQVTNERTNRRHYSLVASDSDCLRHLHPNEARSVGCADNTLQPRAVIYSKNHTRAKFNALGIK